jgi:hypothetical protein
MVSQSWFKKNPGFRRDRVGHASKDGLEETATINTFCPEDSPAASVISGSAAAGIVSIRIL